MSIRVKLLIACEVVIAGFSVRLAAAFPSHSWGRFLVYLVAVLLSSGLKVTLPKGDGTMTVNFPFILLSIIQFSPGQALLLAAASVLRAVPDQGSQGIHACPDSVQCPRTSSRRP